MQNRYMDIMDIMDILILTFDFDLEKKIESRSKKTVLFHKFIQD